jgi:hypothetical protein
MFEKSLDNNGAAPAAPTGSNQPENFDNDAEVTKLESEIDAVLATPDDDDPDDEDTGYHTKEETRCAGNIQDWSCVA